MIEAKAGDFRTPLRPRLQSEDPREIVIAPFDIHEGLHIKITEANWKEMMANVNPMKRKKDYFADDRASFRRSIEEAYRVLQLLDREGYHEEDVSLMTQGQAKRGDRTVAFIQVPDGTFFVFVREEWQRHSTRDFLACTYKLEPNKNFVTREELVVGRGRGQKQPTILDHTADHEGIVGFTGLDIISAQVSVGEVRQLTQTLQHDVASIQLPDRD